MTPSTARFRRLRSLKRGWPAAIASILAIAAVAGLDPGHAKDAKPQPSAKSTVDLANPLVGTAPLDRQEWIGNSPPPGELLYSGMTSPGASLPQSSTEAAPVNVNADLSYPAGVDTSYFYGQPTMFGFTGGGATYGARAAPMISPVVGDWTVPPDYKASY